MVDVRKDYPLFQNAGAEVAVITMGSPPQVANFRKRLNLPFICLSDRSQDAYRAYSVPRGSVAQIAGPRTWLAGLQAIWRGGFGIPHGDLYQLPASFVVDQQGKTRFAHRPETSSDVPNHDEMIVAICDAPRGS